MVHLRQREEKRTEREKDHDRNQRGVTKAKWRRRVEAGFGSNFYRRLAGKRGEKESGKRGGS